MVDIEKAAPAGVTSIKGSCLCHRIQYELHGTPSTYIICHCDNRRKASVSAFVASSSGYAKEHFKPTQGQHFLQTYNDDQADSGSMIHCSFCRACGSPLLINHSEHKDLVSVAVGSKDGQQLDWRPEHELYCKRKLGFLPEVEGAVYHEEGDE